MPLLLAKRTIGFRVVTMEVIWDEETCYLFSISILFHLCKVEFMYDFLLSEPAVMVASTDLPNLI
jgi:hypothetical protein